MTLDHEEFDRRLAEADDLHALDADLTEHAANCDRCNTRLAMSRRIRSAAPSLVEADYDDNITDVVLARTQRTTTRRPLFLAVAAGLLLVVGTVGIVLRPDDTATDVLADIADSYANGDDFRFVYETEAAIDISEQFDLEPVGPADLSALSTQIPTCTTADEESEAGDQIGELDLGPIVDAIASNDPCLALQLIDDSARPAQEAFDSLARSITTRQATLEQISESRADDPLIAAAADAFVSEQRDKITAAQDALTNLDRSYTAVAEAAEPLASNTFSAVDVETSLTALRADIVTAANTATEIDPVIEWTQIATGTWSPDGVAVGGVTERDGQSADYTAVDDDPLGLAAVVLDDPATLVELLDSAPASDNDVIEWDVPANVLDSDLAWTATARLDNGRLATLQIRSDVATITFTPQR